MQEQYQYKIEKIDQNEIVGYIINTNAPYEKIICELCDNDKTIKTFTPNICRNELSILKLCNNITTSYLNCGFSIKLPKYLNNGEKHIISLKIMHSNFIFFINDKLFFDKNNKNKTIINKYAYYIDKVDQDIIKGWIYDKNDPTKRLTIIVEENNQEIITFKADQYRADVKQRTQSDGFSCFCIKTPQALCDGYLHNLVFKIKDDNTVFFKKDNVLFNLPIYYIHVFNNNYINGKVYLEKYLSKQLNIDVLYKDQILASCFTGHSHSFQIFLDKTEFLENDLENIAHNGYIELSLAVNKNKFISKNFSCITSKNLKNLIIFNLITDNLIQGTYYSFTHEMFTSNLITCTIDENITIPLVLNEHFDFDIDISLLKLSDGIHQIKFICDQYNNDNILEYNFYFTRFYFNIDFQDCGMLLTLNDNLNDDQLIFEYLIDNYPINSVNTSKLIKQNNCYQNIYLDIPIKFLDGQTHNLVFRILGDDKLYPERPILFKTQQNKQIIYKLNIDALHLNGWAFQPFDLQKSLNVLIYQNNNLIYSLVANNSHHETQTNPYFPDQHGFDLDLKSGIYTLSIENENSVLVTEQIDIPHNFENYTLRQASNNRSGICIILPELDNKQSYEEIRELLYLGAALSEIYDDNIDFIFQNSLKVDPNNSIEKFLIENAGKKITEILQNSSFFLLPDSLIQNTATGLQKNAFNLDLYLRYNSYDYVFCTSRKGILAYAVMAKHQGLYHLSTQFYILVNTFAIEDRLLSCKLLDDPMLLFYESFEKQTVKYSDHILITNKFHHLLLSKINPHVSKKIIKIIYNLQLKNHNLIQFDQNYKWLIFIGILSPICGLDIFMQTLEKFVISYKQYSQQLAVAFIGESDYIYDQNAIEYIKSKSVLLNIKIEIYSDVQFDDYIDLVYSFINIGVVVNYYYLEGTPWASVIQNAKLDILQNNLFEDHNSSSFINLLVNFITNHYNNKYYLQNNIQDSNLKLLFNITQNTQLNKIYDTNDSITVCISHYNRPTFLRQLLNSILLCHYKNLEIIIVDDGSDVIYKKDLQEIEQWISQYNGKILYKQNEYLGATRNFAAQAAKSKYLVFMDDDNLAMPNMFSELLNVQKRTNADIVTCFFAIFEENQIINSLTDFPSKIGVPFSPDIATGVINNSYGDANMLITKEAFQRIGGFTTDYGVGHEDWELFGKAALLGLSHELVPLPLFWYRMSPSSMLRNRESDNPSLLRNIRAYNSLPHEQYRIIQLLQGLVKRWNREYQPNHANIANHYRNIHQIAWGRVAVIMRTKNRPLLLERAILSVLHQTFSDWCLVIVNDGGDRDTVEKIVNKYKMEAQGRIHTLHNSESYGMESASNLGILNSSSEYIVIHDDDDSWHPDFLQTCIKHLDNAVAEIAGVVTLVTVVVEKIEHDNIIEISRHLFKKIDVLSLYDMLVENQFPPICFVFKRSVLEHIGMFDGNLPVLGDWDFHLRVLKKFDIDVIAKELALYHHRIQGTNNEYSNTVTDQSNLHQLQRVKYLNKSLRNYFNDQKYNEDECMYFANLFNKEQSELYSLLNSFKNFEKLMNDERKHTAWIEGLINNLIDKINKLKK